jgi:branched-chain amino acid transport system permease protein
MPGSAKTRYDDDQQLFKSPGAAFSYAVLAALLLAAPFLLGSYYISQLDFVMIYAIVGVALNILSGQAGQVSIGHAAFLAIGAYSAAIAQKHGLPFPVYLVMAGALTGIVGYLVGLPTLRLHGIYLAIATFAFAFIVEEIITRWEAVTNGNEGLMLAPPTFLTFRLGGTGFYYLCLSITSIVMLAAINIVRSPTGRAFIAIRDSETAARSMGIDTTRYKTWAFAISAAITGIAGVLYAHKLSFITPDMFTLSLSIDFVMIIIIGGILSLRGAVFGAIFMIMVDPLLIMLKDELPKFTEAIMQTAGLTGHIAESIQGGVLHVLNASGLKSLIFGLIIIFFIIFEPLGLDGRWHRVKAYFHQFPLYRPSNLGRQKMFLKSERNR